MTVSSSTNRVAYTGAGTTGPFTITFYFLENDDLLVLKETIATGVFTTLALTTDYTLTGAADPAGGELTLVATLSASYRLHIIRNPDLQQGTDYGEGDKFPAASHEQALDKLTMQMQRVYDFLNRALKAPDTNSTDMVLSGADWAARASQFLAFDASGNLIVAAEAVGVPVTAFIETLLDDADAAAALTTLGIPTPFSVANGGTGRTTGSSPNSIILTGTTATGAQRTLPSGNSGDVLVSGGAGVDPAFTTPTGSGAPVKANAPTLSGTVTVNQTSANTAAVATVGSAATQTKHFDGSGSTTAAGYGVITNTSGAVLWGVESSAGGQLITSAAAYRAVLRGGSGISFSGDAGTTRHADLTSAGIFTVGGSGDVTGSGALFNASQATSGSFISGLRHTHASNPSGIYVLYDSNPNDNAHSAYRFDSSAGMKFGVDSNGGCASIQANDRNLSDIRTKPVFEDYTPEMLDELEAKFCALRRGRFKMDGQTHDDWNYGKSAQSVAEHFPELSDVWATTQKEEITKIELVDGPILDAEGKALKVERERKELVEVEIPKDKQLICEYPHDIQQIGEALFVRALSRIKDLELRIAKLER